MIFETSWDDGTKEDFYLIALLQKYSMPATFYIPIEGELTPEEIKKVAKHFEVGSHTVSHPADLKQLEVDMMDFEILTSKQMLETIVERPVTKFCYPRGRYDEVVKNRVIQAGYSEARSTVVLSLEAGDPFAKKTTIHVYQRKEYQGVDWLEMAKQYLDLAIEGDKYFHLWGHSKEIERDKNWEKLEEFFKYAKPKLEAIKN